MSNEGGKGRGAECVSKACTEQIRVGELVSGACINSPCECRRPVAVSKRESVGYGTLLERCGVKYVLQEKEE